MTLENFTPWSAILGGALLGLSASILMAVQGRVAGISGILGGLLRPRAGEVAWRATFVLGLLAGGVALLALHPGAFGVAPTRSPAMLVGAGLLVGFGTRMGNGCTSGHGVCGLSRGSPRSAAAVATFMGTGFLTATVIGLLLEAS